MDNKFYHLKIFFNSLSKNEKKRIFKLISLVIIGLIIETFGLGLLIPLFTLILNFENYISSIDNLFPYFEIKTYNYNKVVFFSFFVVFLIYIFKTVFNIFLTYFQNNLFFSILKKTKFNLHKNYISSDLNQFNKTDITTKIKNLQIELNHFIGYIQAIFNTFSEALYNFGILILLLYIDFLQALLIIVFFLTFLIISFNSTKKSLKDLSKTKILLNDNIQSQIFDSLMNYKTIFLGRKQNYFNEKFSLTLEKMKTVNINSNTIKAIPRYILELFVVVLVMIILSIKLYLNQSSSQIITSLGLFAAALFKVFPSVNKIIASSQLISNYKLMFNLIIEELNPVKTKNLFFNSDKIEFKNNLILKNINFKYSRDSSLILNKLNLKISEKEIFGIIGKSGTGKTTLIEIILGLRKITSGSYIIDSKIINNPRCLITSQIFGYLPQEVRLIKGSIIENIAFGHNKETVDMSRIKKSIKLSKLNSMIENLPNGLNTKVGDKGFDLSGGQRQRIGLARAIYDEPRILVLDEPTSSLDSVTERSLIENILELNLTIIMVTHNKKLLKYCNNFISIDND